MFKTFYDMLKSDERIQFTVTRKGDQLAVLVQPVLQGMADDKASETIQSLRGALSMPLYVVTHPENLKHYCGHPHQKRGMVMKLERMIF